jgi:mono/diheme cytochrome c family protein
MQSDGNRRRRAVRIAAAFGVFIAAVAAGVAAFVYSGVYDMSATTPHSGATLNVLRTAMERSVKRQARKVEVPELDDPEKVHAGLLSFQEMCVVCHGAPGEPRTQLSKGLYPKAPNLAQAAKAWTPAELYVITKGGIKMSGMPAWGSTHSDEQLWQIVAFLKLLPTMPEAEYRDAVAYFATNTSGRMPGMQAGHH